MIRYSQQDKRWANEKLGTGTKTIKDWGCLLCCAAMACADKGFGETPSTLNAKMRAIGGFSGALINLWKLESAVPGMRYIDFINCRNFAAPIAQIDAVLASGHHVAVLVDYDPAKAGIQDHYVVLNKKIGNDYIIRDPWPLQDAENVFLMARFGQGKTLEQAIYEVCVIAGGSGAVSEPVEEPVSAVEAVTMLPHVGDVYTPVIDYVNDRAEPSTRSADVGDIPNGQQIVLSDDAILDAEGTIWAPHQVTVTYTRYAAIRYQGRDLMKRVTPAPVGDGE